MKILYVIESLSTGGGLERILIDKMNALSQQPNQEIVLMTVWRDEKPLAFPLSERVSHICLDVGQPHSSFVFAMALPRVLCRYNKALGKIHPDVVVHFRAVGCFLIAFSSWKGRTVFESHNAKHFNNHLWLYPRMERKVGTLVSLTEEDAREYTCARDVRVIPNFTDIRPSSLPDYSSRHCVFVGRLCDQKNPQRLLLLWHEIARSYPDWVLDIYGEGELRDDVARFIQMSGLSESVVLHGFDKDISRVYASGSIMLMTSHYEGFPLAIVEAMTCGLPVISFDIKCGPRELIVDGETGFLIPPDSNKSYVDAVLRLMDDEALRREMGHRAMERARLYDKDTIIQKWVELFKETDILRLCTYSK